MRALTTASDKAHSQAPLAVAVGFERLRDTFIDIQAKLKGRSQAGNS